MLLKWQVYFQSHQAFIQVLSFLLCKNITGKLLMEMRDYRDYFGVEFEKLEDVVSVTSFCCLNGIHFNCDQVNNIFSLQIE